MDEKAGWPGHTIEIRVRYSETDQMGTFYNSRALEWFECGRTETLRYLGLEYTGLEARGIYLPIVESHIEYRGRARYDDRLRISTRVGMIGRARVRFEVSIVQASTGADVARGYTIHAITDQPGRPMRPPAWFVDALGNAKE